MIKVGDRVNAYDYNGESYGPGTVFEVQALNGEYLRVRLDGVTDKVGFKGGRGIEMVFRKDKVRRIVRRGDLTDDQRRAIKKKRRDMLTTRR